MTTFFAPYIGEHPAAVVINGHRVGILSREPAQIEHSLDLVGADCVKPLEGEIFGSEDQLVQSFAKTSQAHVVVTPAESSVADIIQTLADELPWMQ